MQDRQEVLGSPCGEELLKSSYNYRRSRRKVLTKLVCGTLITQTRVTTRNGQREKKILIARDSYVRDLKAIIRNHNCVIDYKQSRKNSLVKKCQEWESRTSYEWNANKSTGNNLHLCRSQTTATRKAQTSVCSSEILNRHRTNGIVSSVAEVLNLEE